MVTITVNDEAGKIEINGEESNRMEFVSAVYAAITAISDLEKISYDAAKIKTMELLVKVEQFQELQKNIKKDIGENALEQIMKIVKEAVEKDD